MTLLQLASAHCANWQAGSCLGIRLNDALGARCLVKNAKCLLGTRGVRCAYFEESVMPMGRADWPGLQTPKEHDAFSRAVKSYRLSANVAAEPARPCPDCGRALEKARRYCYQCREKRRKASLRAANQNRNGSTTVNA